MGVGVAGVANYTNTSSGTASNVVAYGGVGGPYEYCSFFSVLNWFAAGEQGAWYDPSDLTTLFQDSAGTTPVTALEQPVGLMLDKSKGLALGVELVTNGTFDANVAGWSIETGGALAWVSGGMRITGVGFNAYQAFTTVVGRWYEFYFTPVSNGMQCIVSVGNSIGGTEDFSIGSAATRSHAFFYASATTTYVSIKTLGSAAIFDNISVKQIAGNHAFQAANANRPILSARVNLLTKTEDFSDAIWNTLGSVTKTNNYTYAPDGTLTAGRVVFASNSSSNQFFQYQVTAATSYTQKIWVKVPTGSANIMFGFYDGAIKTVSIPLTSQWQQISYSDTVIAGGGTRSLWLYPTGSEGMATEIHIWHPDFRPTNSGALLPPYQRVNTASDYDSVGFPLYLKANGTSSAMSTNSIDFTATDKMTVVTGVRKLSDATGVILEESPRTDGSNGGFIIHTTTSPANGYTIGCSSSNSGVQFSGQTVTTFTAPVNNVVSVLYDLSKTLVADVVTPKVNGSIPTKSTVGTSPVIGTFRNYPLYLFARAGTSLFFYGQFYGAIIRGAQSDTASVVQTENYMAQKTGITF